MSHVEDINTTENFDIAVVGMACRFPGARNLDEFWQNLKNGVESIKFLTDDELTAAHVLPEIFQQAEYIRATPFLEDTEVFDAKFFGYSPKEAAMMDPQQRLFLETAWHALEHAGYDPERVDGDIGVFAGAGFSWYLIDNLLLGRSGLQNIPDTFLLQVANDKDNLATRTSYKLNLTGPSVTVQTTCSTGLVAVHLASQSLINLECDMALAGGVAVKAPQVGYIYQKDMVMSNDGHCRPFDANASGTVFGSGVGVVVLKRFAEAVADHDHILAVIKGSAINNDGASKVGFTAPSVDGQTKVIARALALANVPVDTIGAIETHGTGTFLGDPIEIEALNKIFGPSIKERAVCAIGSVKSNIGHLETAAGIASFIKMILSLQHQWLVPSLNFQEPNPHLNLDKTPFYVNTTSQPWPAKQDGLPRRGGVSSFGVGGTNAHVILEEAPPQAPSAPSARPVHLLQLSAKTKKSLTQLGQDLLAYLQTHPEVNFADVIHTLRHGRQAFEQRQVVVCRNRDDAIRILATNEAEKTWKSPAILEDPKVVFMFPGQGSQYVNMGREVYDQEPLFRQIVDQCATTLKQHLGLDIRDILYPADAGAIEANSARLTQTLIAQPAIFVIEYALAKLWESWGIRPYAMLGHSVGEYAAACLAGVFSLEDGLYILAERAKLINALPTGAMCVVPLAADDLRPLLGTEVALATLNGPTLSVVSGPTEAIRQFQTMMEQRNVACRLLQTSHAFHSAMMNPIREPFGAVLQKVRFNAPHLPYFSNLTGTWIRDDEVANPQYWINHILQTVRFSPAVTELLRQPGVLFLEVGAGTTLNSLVKNHAATSITIASLPHPKDERSALEHLVGAVGRLWLAGVEPQWEAFQDQEPQQRIVLPLYPFERNRYWIDPTPAVGATADADMLAGFRMETSAADGEPDADFVAPSTPWEQQVAPIFGEVLGFAKVSADHNFFDLGGHSLLATQLLDKVNKTFDVAIRLREFLHKPNIIGLGELVAQSANIAPSERIKYELPEFVADPDQHYAPFPLTEMQQVQWLGRIGAFAMGNVAAHVYFETEKSGLDVARLHSTWQKMIDRHEMLRAVLLSDGGQKILASTPPYQIKHCDLRQERPDQIDARLLQIRNEMDHVVRPVEQWPLFEVRTTMLPGDRVRIHFSIDLLICDVASVRIIMRDWALMYGEPELLTSQPTLSFRDYVMTFQKLQGTKLYEASSAFWNQRITELPAMPGLPLIKNPSAITAPHSKRWSMRMNMERWQQLKNQGSKRGVSASAILLTVFGEVLANWSKTTSFCVNTTVINRMPFHPEVEKIVGEFASFAPVEIRLNSDTTIEALARQIQDRTWENLENRYVHGATILRKLAQYRGEASGAVLPVVFTSTLVQEVEDEDKFAQQFGNIGYFISQTPQVWLDFIVWEDEQGLLLGLHAVIDLFPEGLIDTMWTACEALVNRLVDDERTWTDFRYYALTPQTEIDLLRAVNATAVELPPAYLQSAFFAQAVTQPQQVAVIDVAKTLTYGELADYANRLGGYLRSLAVQPGQLVAVVMEKGWEQIVSVLGILQAGGAYLPLDADLPKDRLWYILQEAQVKVALVQAKDADQIDVPENVRKVVVSEQTLPALPACRLTPVQQVDDLAYVIYTSGSTGHPKGVMISHRGAHNTIADINRRFHATATDRVLALSGLNFDLSVYDVFGLLSVGGAIVIPKPGANRDPQHWLELVTQQHITIWNSVPALMEMFVEYLEGQQPIGVPLRLVLLSGDWIPVALPDRIKANVAGIDIISLGGATEASIWSIFYPIRKVDPAWTSIPYGKPLANQTMYVLDDNLETCPIWCSGGIYIGGVGVALGYFNNAELTAKAFITHPKTGERLYRTGDLGRYLPDGNMEFLGREDFQVKISGFRIELEEIETVLNDHPAVQSAVVTAWGKAQERKRLIAYVIGKAGSTLDLEELEAGLRQQLPTYMIPSEFIVMDAFPLTTSGKVDRKALPKPRLARSGGTNLAQAGGVVQKLMTIFGEILGIPPEQIDIYENFFAMGGDSVMGVQVISRANQEGLNISPEQLFENPTIADMAKGLEAQYGALTKEQERFTGVVPLTPLQQQMLQQSGDLTVQRNLGLLLTCSQPVMPEVLETALQRVVSQQDALQLHYLKKEGLWQQAYHESAPVVELDLVDVTGMAADEMELTLRDIWQTLNDSQDLSKSPLLKCCVFQDDDAHRSQILVVANQLIMDYRTVGLFMEELGGAYQQLRDRPDAVFAAKGAAFKTWSTRVSERSQAPAIWREKAYATGLPQQVPSLQTVCAGTTDGRSQIMVTLADAALMQACQEVAATARMSLEELVLTALALTLNTTQTATGAYVDWLVAPSTELAKATGIERAVGNFRWPFPVLLDVKREQPLAATIKVSKELLRQCHNGGESYGMLRYLVNGGYGDEDVRKAARPQIAFSYSQIPIPQSFSVEHMALYKSAIADHAGYLLDIDLVEMNNTFTLLMNFQPQSWTAEAVEALGQAVWQTVRELIQAVQTCDATALLSPTDFAEADVDQAEFERFLTAFTQSA